MEGNYESPTKRKVREETARLKRLSVVQASILRQSFSSRLSEILEVVDPLLKHGKSTNLTSLAGIEQRIADVRSWGELSLGSAENIDIGGGIFGEEADFMRKELARLKKSENIDASNDENDENGQQKDGKKDSLALKLKLKEMKKAVKKLEKEKSKLLVKLQKSQGLEGGAGGPPGGPPPSSTKKGLGPLPPKKGPSSGPPPSKNGPSGPPPPTSSAATDALKTEVANLQSANKSLTDSNLSLKEKCEMLTVDVKNFEAEAEERKRNEEGKTSEVEKLRQEVASAKQEGDAILTAAKAQFDLELEKEKLEHKKTIADLEAKCSKMAKANSAWISDVKRLQETIQCLQACHRKLQTDIVKNTLQGSMISLIADTGKSVLQATQSVQENDKSLRDNYEKEVKERKRLFNLVQELRGNIRVFCRCRPPLPKELEKNEGGSEIVVKFPEEGAVSLKNDKGKEKIWEFDQIFGLKTEQATVYDEVSPLVTSVLDGYNVCIFAYGQTGTGKTFTMMGDMEGPNAGVNTRALAELFEKSKKRSKVVQDTITVSILEVYNEAIKDLLTSDGDRKYTVREGPHGNYVPDLTIVKVSSLSDVMDLLELSHANRATAKTNMNEHSSRSHLILSVYVESKNVLSGEVTRGKVSSQRLRHVDQYTLALHLFPCPPFSPTPTIYISTSSFSFLFVSMLSFLTLLLSSSLFPAPPDRSGR